VLLRHFVGIARRDHFDHMRSHHTAGRLGDSKVAVLGIASQALFERIRAMMRGDKGMLGRP